MVAEAADSDEVEIVYVREPTKEQEELARQLMLPLTFFCYKNEPGYVSDDDEDGTGHFPVSLHHLPFREIVCFFLTGYPFCR